MSLLNVAGEIILKPIESPVIGMIVVIQMKDNPNGQWTCSLTEDFDKITYGKDTSEMSRMYVSTPDGEYPVDHLKDVQKILRNDMVGKIILGQIYVDYKLGTEYFGLDDNIAVPITIESMREAFNKSKEIVDKADHIISITRSTDPQDANIKIRKLNPTMDSLYISLKEIIETMGLPLDAEERDKIIERGKTALKNYEA